MLFVAAIILVYGAAIVLTGVTALQGMEIRRSNEALKQVTRDAEARSAVQTEKTTCTNGLRAYAVSFNMTMSERLTQLRRPHFGTHTLRGSCETAGTTVQSRLVSYANPTWLVIDGTRSADTMINDVRSGAVQYLVLEGHVCKARVPSQEETKKVRESIEDVDVRQNARLLVVASDADVDQGESECVLPWVHPFPVPSGDWKDVVKNRAHRESDAGGARARTIAHVWGYGIAALPDGLI
jgi:hypothetical protein